MNKLTLYHGSPVIVENPEYGKGKAYNDYGQGFYCTEHIELAREWGCSENRDGYVNCYELDLTGLKVLRLSHTIQKGENEEIEDAHPAEVAKSGELKSGATMPNQSSHSNVLSWLAILMENRVVTLTSPVAKRGRAYIIENFLPDYKQYDIIIGYRADDSYFSFARAFLENGISVQQLEYAMRLGELGEQVVIKSEKAFASLTYKGYEVANNSEYYPRKKARDEGARKAYIAELDRQDMSGIYMQDLLRKKAKGEDIICGESKDDDLLGKDTK